MTGEPLSRQTGVHRAGMTPFTVKDALGYLDVKELAVRWGWGELQEMVDPKGQGTCQRRSWQRPQEGGKEGTLKMTS